jgi:hypothetical protein
MVAPTSVVQVTSPTPQQRLVAQEPLASTQTPKPAQPAPPPAMTSGSQLIAAMHDRYADKWYRTLTFVQTTTLTRGGAPIVQTWYEAAYLPGRLRIDTNLGMKSGAVYARDSVYSFADGKLVGADSGYNELLLLGFDVYTQPAARTDGILRHLGVDLSKIHEATWNGRPVYVVGAALGDTTSKQFWVDRERLLFVRLVEKTPRGYTDFRFNKYEQVSGGWIATEVQQLVNGSRVLLEEYRDVRPYTTLSTALFDPRQWLTAAHWSR